MNLSRDGVTDRGQRFAAAAAGFADQVLVKGRDRYGSASTPLLADGADVRSGQPVTWRSQGEAWIVSNLANQQNLLRTLRAASEVTGRSEYAEHANEVLTYAFEHLRYGKLFAWGGHLAFDLSRKRQIFAADKGPQHELKCHFPYYEAMFEVDPLETCAYLEALWESHVTNWDNLEFSRHGLPAERSQVAPSVTLVSGKPKVQLSKLWDREYAAEPVFFIGKGLTFINAGSDLIYGAAMLAHLTGDERPLAWAKRLAKRYVETRHPDTGLGGYQFSMSILPGQRGDRAVEQFGEQLWGHQPIEANLCVPRQIHTIIGESALCKLALAERLGRAGAEFRGWALEDLLAYRRHAYDPQDNTLHPILTDGTRLTGLVPLKDGYYGKRDRPLQAIRADCAILWSYAMGYRLTGSPELWETARSIARHHGLGDIGEAGGRGPALAASTPCADPLAVFALLELEQAVNAGDYLRLACTVGDNILDSRLHHGFFLPSAKHLYAKFDAIEPLALLHLAGALRGERERLPVYFGGKPFFGAAYDGHGHEKDNEFFYARTDEDGTR